MGLGPEEAGSFGVAGGSMLGRGSCGPIGAGEAALEALHDRTVVIFRVTGKGNGTRVSWPVAIVGGYYHRVPLPNRVAVRAGTWGSRDRRVRPLRRVRGRLRPQWA